MYKGSASIYTTKFFFCLFSVSIGTAEAAIYYCQVSDLAELSSRAWIHSLATLVIPTSQKELSRNVPCFFFFPLEVNTNHLYSTCPVWDVRGSGQWISYPMVHTDQQSIAYYLLSLSLLSFVLPALWTKFGDLIISTALNPTLFEVLNFQ